MALSIALLVVSLVASAASQGFSIGVERSGERETGADGLTLRQGVSTNSRLEGGLPSFLSDLDSDRGLGPRSRFLSPTGSGLLRQDIDGERVGIWGDGPVLDSLDDGRALLDPSVQGGYLRPGLSSVLNGDPSRLGGSTGRRTTVEVEQTNYGRSPLLAGRLGQLDPVLLGGNQPLSSVSSRIGWDRSIEQVPRYRPEQDLWPYLGNEDFGNVLDPFEALDLTRLLKTTIPSLDLSSTPRRALEIFASMFPHVGRQALLNILRSEAHLDPETLMQPLDFVRTLLGDINGSGITPYNYFQKIRSLFLRLGSSGSDFSLDRLFPSVDLKQLMGPSIRFWQRVLRLPTNVLSRFLQNYRPRLRDFNRFLNLLNGGSDPRLSQDWSGQGWNGGRNWGLNGRVGQGALDGDWGLDGLAGRGGRGGLGGDWGLDGRVGQGVLDGDWGLDGLGGRVGTDGLGGNWGLGGLGANDGTSLVVESNRRAGISSGRGLGGLGVGPLDGIRGLGVRGGVGGRGLLPSIGLGVGLDRSRRGVSFGVDL